MKKKFGQNFLTSKDIVKKIIAAANINGNSEVLEVGPGNGTLTEEIIKKNPRKFIAIEIDMDLKKNLEKFFVNDNHYLYIQDSLKFDEKKKFTDNYIIISNLPYNISLALLIKWIYQINTTPHPVKMILMFQKEVADRILAKPNSKKFGRITIIASAFFKITKILDVDKKNFLPMPEVDSTILCFEELKKKKIAFNYINFLEKVTFELFGNRRKQLKKKLEKLFSNNTIKKNLLDDLFLLRAENLTIEIIYKLAVLLKKEKLQL